MIKHKKITILAAIALLLACLGAIWVTRKYNLFEKLALRYGNTRRQPDVAGGEDRGAGLPSPETLEPKIVEKIVTSAQVWRPIQTRVKDTVVQIFAHVAAVDMLRPYRSPSEGSSCGSGFFISEQGDIITNAHVVDQAKAVWIQIPSLGKRIVDVDIVGISPDRDVALLRVRPDSLEIIKKELGAVPFLTLGDSDLVLRSDEVLALGYPLGQQALKSTNGIISGRENSMIQMSAPINPGSSGGPLLNMQGEVIGINSAGVVEAQNVGYAIAINDLKIVLPDLYNVRIVRKPFLGVLFNNASDSLTEYLGNPAPGGCYVAEVVKGSPLDKAGVKQGDMIYEINGYELDIFGDMRVPWSEDKISLIEYVGRLSIGETINLVVYRYGQRKDISLVFGYAELPAIRKIYPGYDTIDYEIFAGMVVMPLSHDHIQLLGPQAPGLTHFAEMRRSTDPALVVTHIFRNSQLFRTRTIKVGSTINEINGIKVATLDDFRKAVKSAMSSKFLTLRASENMSRTTDNVLVAMPMEKLLREEEQLSKDYQYPITPHTQELLKIFNAQAALATKK